MSFQLCSKSSGVARRRPAPSSLYKTITTGRRRQAPLDPLGQNGRFITNGLTGRKTNSRHRILSVRRGALAYAVLQRGHAFIMCTARAGDHVERRIILLCHSLWVAIPVALNFRPMKRHFRAETCAEQQLPSLSPWPAIAAIVGAMAASTVQRRHERDTRIMPRWFCSTESR
jgi:hypothetical protein